MIDERYPDAPGYKAATPETSRASALAVEDRAQTLREWALAVLEEGPATADEVAAAMLGESVLAVRPRLSELRAQGRIEPTGERRKNTSGHSAAVWQVVRTQRQEEFAL